MATNRPVGDNSRVGAVRGRSQVYNPTTGLWTKRDAQTGKFMDVKTSSNTPFKGVRKEKQYSKVSGKEVIWQSHFASLLCYNENCCSYGGIYEKKETQEEK